jgi:hypothetical protein
MAYTSTGETPKVDWKDADTESENGSSSDERLFIKPGPDGLYTCGTCGNRWDGNSQCPCYQSFPCMPDVTETDLGGNGSCNSHP